MISFVVGLIVIVVIAGVFGINVPLMGSIKHCFTITIHPQRFEHKRFGFSRLSIALLPCNSSRRTMHRCHDYTMDKLQNPLTASAATAIPAPEDTAIS